MTATVTALQDAILGCIVGGAIGDAAGIRYEGVRPGTQLPATLKLDRLSDDTQMTLATCEALCATGLDPAGIARAFVAWHGAGRFHGIGATTYLSLSALSAGGHWARSAPSDEGAAGNGAAMRIAPLAFALALTDRAAIRDVARITHNNPESHAGALAMVHAIAWRERLGPALLHEIAMALPAGPLRLRLLEYAVCDEPIEVAGAHFGATDYVVQSVPLAIYAATQVRSIGFEPMMRALIRAGGDTDTTCAMAGQIAGAALGFSAFPATLIKKLPDRELVLHHATAFAGWAESRLSA